jgi:hypothetical protein
VIIARQEIQKILVTIMENMKTLQEFPENVVNRFTYLGGVKIMKSSWL